jgi:MFS transporter, FHS family, glucose/mannose:H+ symporter
MSNPASPSALVQRNSLATSIALHSGFFLTGVITALLGPLLPAIRMHYGVTVEQVGELFVAQFVGSSLGALLSQLRIRISVVLGFALICIGVVAFPFATWLFAPAAVFAFGVGLGLVIPATNVLVAQTQRETRAASLNVLNLFWGAGAATCPIVVAALQERLGFSRTLIAFGALAGLIFIAFIASTNLPTWHSDEQSSISTKRPRSSRMLLIFCLLLFLYVGIETSIGGWTSTYVGTIAGEGPWMTWIVAAFWSALLAGRALAPLTLRIIGEKMLLWWSLVLSIIGVFGLILIHSPSGAIAFTVVIGVGLAPLFALLFSILSRYSESANIAAPGWLFAGIGLGGAALPWTVGLVTSKTGSIRSGFAIVGISVVFMFAIIAMLHRRTKSYVWNSH